MTVESQKVSEMPVSVLFASFANMNRTSAFFWANPILLTLTLPRLFVGKLKKQPAGSSSAEDSARQIDFCDFQTVEKGSHSLYLVEAAVFDVLASEPAMDRPALESHGEFPQLPGVELRLTLHLRNKSSQELAFVRREFDRAQERTFDRPADHFFDLRNQIVPETIANHLPAQVCGIFAKFETEGRGKFVDFVFPDLE